MGPHLLVAISPHGFGHTAQTAVVVNALRRRLPELRLTLRTTVPMTLLQSRFAGDWALDASADDFGMEMASAIDVRAEDSARAYARWHQDWQHKVATTAETLAAMAPDLVLANVPYLSLAAAAHAEIPAIAMCSLNWADIYRYYCGFAPEAKEIHGQMLAAYNSAALFLQTEPGMPMPDLTNRRSIGPLARLGTDHRREIHEHLDLPATIRLVLVNMGGISMRLPMEDWPRLEHIRWIVEPSWQVHRSDVIPLDVLDLSFTDILASCDAVIAKPGYGLIAEAGCNAVPMLYVRRRDWPEEPYLIAWLERQGRCLEISRDELQRGELLDALEQLWAMPPPVQVIPTGVDQGADALQRMLLPPKADLPLAT